MSAGIEEIEREIDEILRKAELERMRIVEAARRKAKEILDKPIPLDDAHSLAKEIITKAEREAEEIIRDAERKAMEMKRIGSDIVEEIVSIIVKRVAGVD